jgi:hypothetical protein
MKTLKFFSITEMTLESIVKTELDAFMSEFKEIIQRHQLSGDIEDLCRNFTLTLFQEQLDEILRDYLLKTPDSEGSVGQSPFEQSSRNLIDLFREDSQSTSKVALNQEDYIQIPEFLKYKINKKGSVINKDGFEMKQFYGKVVLYQDSKHHTRSVRKLIKRLFSN